MKTLPIEIPFESLAEICHKFSVKRLELFGSVLRDDFCEASDVDVLAEYEPENKRTLLDEAALEMELERLFGRKVDLLSHSAVENSENSLRRARILNAAEVLYER